MAKAAKNKPPQAWPAAKVEMRPLSWIKPYELNPRSHPPAQISLIASSMEVDGVTAPIFVDEGGVIIYGHGRRLAALQNGYEEYPVLIARGWSDERKRAYRIKDNSFGELSGWDLELMQVEISMLKEVGYDLPLLGFGDAQLVQFTTTPGPPGFAAVDDDLYTDNECPKCGYRWSGGRSAPKDEKPKAAGKTKARKK